MLVKCLSNEISALRDDAIRAHVAEHVHMDSIDLMIGECYQVFGVCFRAGIPWYLLCIATTDDYPTPFCSAFFELIDAEITEGWCLCLSDSNVGSVSILPGRWASDSRFLEKLVDGNIEAVSYFNDLKLMEAGRSKRQSADACER